MQTEKRKAVGYVRVSTTNQAKEGESLDTQKKQIQAYCDLNGLDLIEIYEDAGITGSKVEAREGFLSMMTDAGNSKFDVVIFTKLSRFARNTRDYLRYQFELGEHGVTLASIKENIDPTTNNGRLVAGLFALVAEWEREMIIEQMLENKLIRWKEKRIFNGCTPYGYRWNKKELKLEVNPDEAKIVVNIFRWYTKLGFSLRDLRDKLDSEGFRSRRARWTNGTISGILNNDCYSTGKLPTNTRVYKDNKRTGELKPEADWIIYDVPQLITMSMYEEVKKRRKFNKTKQKRTTWQKDYWLRGSLYCGPCGSRMRVRKGNDKKDKSSNKYYICHWSICSKRDLKYDNKVRCQQGNVRAEQLEGYLWDRITFMLTGQHHNPKTEETNFQIANDRLIPIFNDSFINNIDQQRSKIVRLETKIKELNRSNEGLLDFVEKKKEGVELILRRYESNEKEMVLVNEELAKARNQLAELIDALENRESFQKNKDYLFEIWNDLQDFNEYDKQRFIESLVPNGVIISISKNPHHGKTHNKLLGPNNVHFDTVWNSDIFDYFKGENKFPSLCPNGTYNITTAYV